MQESSHYEKNEPLAESAKQKKEKRIDIKPLKVNETEEQFDRSQIGKHVGKLLSMRDIPSDVKAKESNNLKIDLSKVNKKLTNQFEGVEEGTLFSTKILIF